MAPKNNPKDIKVTLLLTLMVALGPLSTDLYLPSLPSLTETFGTTISRVQATMSVFIGGFACATVIYGPLSDRFGRRPVLIGGMAIFVVGSLVDRGSDLLAVCTSGWRMRRPRNCQSGRA